MNKIEEDFKRVDQARLTEIQMDQRITIFLDMHKDDPLLQEYISLVEEKEKVAKEYDNAKTYLYEDMMREDIDILNGENVDVSLVRPYLKKDINRKKFFEMFKENSKTYKELVEEKEVKGHINLKFLKEDR